MFTKHLILWGLIPALFLVGLWGKGSLEKKLEILPSKGPSLYAKTARYHARSLKHYSLGFGHLLSDLLWIRLLQNARHKTSEPGKVSWEFVQLDAITTLDPKFETAYPFGGAFLSVFLRDNLGAKIVLEKWAKRRPRYWKSHYLLGYHLFFEMSDYKSAATHILKAASLENAPHWLSSLGIRLLSESGGLMQALKTALSLYPSIQNQKAKDRIVTRIRSIRFTLAKRAWEEALKTYRNTHKKEPLDIDSLSPLLKGQSRQLASILFNTDIPKELGALFEERFQFRYDNGQKTIVPLQSVPEIELPGIYHYETGES